MDVGLVCDQCDTFNPMTGGACAGCGAMISLGSEAPAMTVAAAAPAPPAASVRTTAASSTAPSNTGTFRTCDRCGAPLAADHRFCGKCGAQPAASPAPAPAPPARAGGRTMFFGAMQAPNRAKLILIRGEGLDGVSYHLSGTDHIAGRLEGEILFPEDPMLSPQHANFFYRDEQLFVRDQNSINGVFIRIHEPTVLYSGDLFLVGEQLLQVETEHASEQQFVDAEGTTFYGSPKRPSRLKLRQLLRGGHLGMVYRARGDGLTMGREGNDINFPEDPFVSGRHAEVAVEDDHVVLTDLDSRNGTFLRIVEEAPLKHGDYVFLGQQLLRVEIT